MTTTPNQLRDLVRDALAGRTDCGDRVYVPRTWPNRTGKLPALLVRLVGDEKTSPGRGDIQFTVVDTFQLVLQAASVTAGDDAGLLVAEDEAWRIQRQIEVAVLSYGPLLGKLQQIPFLRASVGHNSDGQMSGVEIHTQLGLEYYQGPEDFLAYDGEEVTTAPLGALREVHFDTRLPDGDQSGDREIGPVAVAYPVPSDP